jgi:oligopeptide transport system substrate-binding protein
MNLKRLLTLALVSVCSIFLFGCTEKKSQLKETLRLSIATDPRALDPRTGGDGETSFLIDFLFDGLMQVGRSGTPECAMAQRYEISEDQKTYTFFLREAKWSNGMKVCASDFEYAWKCVLDPQFMTEFSSLMDPIRGAKDAKIGKIPLSDVGIHAVDDNTLIVELEHPCPYFLEALTLSPFKPLCEQHVKTHPKWMNTTGADFVCNGAFTLEDWKASEKLVYKKNPLYWDLSSVRLKRVEISMIENDSAHLALYESDMVDWVGYPINNLPTATIEEIKKKQSVQSLDLPLILMMCFNTERPYLKDQNFRHALSYSIERNLIAKEVMCKGAKPVFSMLPPSLSLHSTPLFKTSSTLAKTALENSLRSLRVKDGDLPKFTLLAPSETYDKVAQVIQQNWSKSLGIEVSIQNMEWKTFFDCISKGDYDIALIGWISGFSDPMYNLNIFASQTNLNFPNWTSPEYTQEIERSNSSASGHERNVHLANAERLLMEAMPIAPIVYYKGLFICREGLKGFVTSKRGDVVFRYAYFENDKTSEKGP